MTTDIDASPRTRRRLVPRADLAAAYQAAYGSAKVAEYALAVRDLVERCPEIGPVDTWSRLAERICRDNPHRDQARWRKTLSGHFTTETKGPPWQTVVLVVRYTLPATEREAALARFADLHEAARGERPPTGERPPAGADPSEQRAVSRLRQENARLRQRLAASEAENDRLRAALRGPTYRRSEPGGESDGSPSSRQHERPGAPNARAFPAHRAGSGPPPNTRPDLPQPAGSTGPDLVPVGRPGATGNEVVWRVEGRWHGRDRFRPTPSGPAVPPPSRPAGWSPAVAGQPTALPVAGWPAG